jgi:ATP-dependent exoDNAse (exonuclease V) beta subunit
MAESFFSPRYYREQVLAHIDAMNMFYVAATRAGRELHLMTAGDGSRSPKNTIGNILRGVLEGGDGNGSGFLDGAFAFSTRSDSGARLEIKRWGTPVKLPKNQPVFDKKSPKQSPIKSPEISDQGLATGVLRTYPTARPDAKIRLKLPSSRYFQGGVEERAQLSPRDFGIAMHRAFEGAVGVDDVWREIGKMAANAAVSQSEFAHLQQLMQRAFSNPLVSEWFGPGWDSVRNEGDILAPKTASEYAVRRPDRVMTRGDRAVVVDYKFGLGESDDHATQLKIYMSLLQNMGYSTVQGYIWYVSLDKIVPVDLPADCAT